MELTSYPKDKIKIVLLEGLHQNSIDIFQKAGYFNIEYHTKAYPEAELIEKISDAHLVGIRSKTLITQQVLAQAPRLLAVGCYCIGVNQVDLATATQNGVAVFNSPYSNTRSVAELVIGESIMLMRRIAHKNRETHAGNWLKDAHNSYELRGKTLGIIGYGHIGSQVSVLAEALGMQILFYDIEPKMPLGNAKAVDTLSELLVNSHIVSLHVPENESTKNMIGKDELAAMRAGSILLNLSRGTVVDIEALAEVLKSGHIAGAGVDVFPEEPEAKGDKFVSLLQGLDNVLLTPHIGGSTQEAQENIGKDASLKLLSYLEKGSTIGCHTIPEISLPPQGSHRILHIHRNTAGVLSGINSLLSKYQLNIEAQYLQTRGEVGYVVMDVDGDIIKNVEQELKHLPHTIRARILY